MIDQQSIPWAEKYRAQGYEDIKGQTLAVDKVKLFLKTFPSKKKAIVLHGPPGIGKTSLAYAIAYEQEAEILELNASDFRNKQKIAEIIKPATQQKSLFKEKKIILVDEVDGVSATKDRGGLGELLGLIEKTGWPIIITANDIWNKKFKLLRTKTEMIALKEIEYKTIKEILQKISNKENITINEEILTSIAIRARGDIRAALNDLQILSKMENPQLLQELGERNKEQSIFTALQHVFKKANIDNEMIRIYDEVNMPIDEVFLWIEENIPLEYSGEELAKAFDALSKADVFRGRIRRQRHWRFLVYENFYLSAGIASAKKYNRTGWTNYKKPSRILKIWLQNQRSAKKKSISKKYAKHTHTSTRTAMKDFLLIKQILQNKNIRKKLDLTEDEEAYLDKPL